MNDLHRLYLSLGSNINAETHLPQAVTILRKVGKVETVSSVWETESVGFDGPNFLNACILFQTSLHHTEFKAQVIRPIENSLGRIRSAEKNAPRTIDIDMLLYDDEPLNIPFWEYAFVIIPLAELTPNFLHPAKRMSLLEVSKQAQGQVWMRKREDVFLDP